MTSGAHGARRDTQPIHDIFHYVGGGVTMHVAAASTRIRATLRQHVAEIHGGENVDWRFSPWRTPGSGGGIYAV